MKKLLLSLLFITGLAYGDSKTDTTITPKKTGGAVIINSGTGGTTIGTTSSGSLNLKTNSVNRMTINSAGTIDPVGGFGTTTNGAASATTSGLVTTGTQTIVGAKTLQSATTISSTLSMGGNISPASTQYIPYMVFNVSYNDNSAHQIYAGGLDCLIMRLNDGGGSTFIPSYAAGGGGVYYRWTVLDPDTGWIINTVGPSFSFAVSGGNTYTLAFDPNTGPISITRTAGAVAYSIRGTTCAY
jgi:hypothetical protein